MRIAELCVKRPVFAVMLISFLVVLGIFSFRDLGVDLFPKADPAVVTVTVLIKGATPEEVNTQVVLPLEEALSTISGMDEMTTQATEGERPDQLQVQPGARHQRRRAGCSRERWPRRFTCCRRISIRRSSSREIRIRTRS